MALNATLARSLSDNDAVNPTNIDSVPIGSMVVNSVRKSEIIVALSIVLKIKAWGLRHD